MSAPTLTARCTTLAFSIALMLSLAPLAACSKQQPPEMPAPAPYVPPPPAAFEKSPAPAATNTKSKAGIYLDTSIAKACGIAQPKSYFEFDSATLQDTAKEDNELASVAACLRTGPLKGKSIEVVGRADPRGTEDYNEALGMSRAQAVSGALQERGLAKDKINERTTGEDMAKGVDEAGWAKDRRVDILLAK